MSQWKTCSGQEKPKGLREPQKRQHIHQLRLKQPKLGLPLPALAALVGCPRRGGELGRGQKQRKAFIWSINTHFPYTTNKLQQHPAGYFQDTTSFLPYPSAKIRYSLKKLLPRKNPIAHGRHQQPEQGAGKRSPGVRGAPAGPSALQALEFPSLFWNKANPMQTGARSTPASASPR